MGLGSTRATGPPPAVPVATSALWYTPRHARRRADDPRVQGQPVRDGADRGGFRAGGIPSHRLRRSRGCLRHQQLLGNRVGGPKESLSGAQGRAHQSGCLGGDDRLPQPAGDRRQLHGGRCRPAGSQPRENAGLRQGGRAPPRPADALVVPGHPPAPPAPHPRHAEGAGRLRALLRLLPNPVHPQGARIAAVAGCRGRSSPARGRGHPRDCGHRSLCGRVRPPDRLRRPGPCRTAAASRRPTGGFPSPTVFHPADRGHRPLDRRICVPPQPLPPPAPVLPIRRRHHSQGDESSVQHAVLQGLGGTPARGGRRHRDHHRPDRRLPRRIPRDARKHPAVRPGCRVPAHPCLPLLAAPAHARGDVEGRCTRRRKETSSYRTAGDCRHISSGIHPATGRRDLGRVGRTGRRRSREVEYIKVRFCADRRWIGRVAPIRILDLHGDGAVGELALPESEIENQLSLTPIRRQGYLPLATAP